ncbi:MAG: MAPEG family protein [Methylocystaceae bacterium]|nr:MAPEG family protein [Methylocystaceae bacterium]
MDIYSPTLTVLAALILLTVIQSLIAMTAHRKQESYIPGIVNSSLDHRSFVFRSHRTFMNSLENVPIFILTVFLGVFLGFSPQHLFWPSVIFLIARLAHMILFYKIATNANPSPRSYFFLIGLLCQFYLLGFIILKLI